MRRDHPVRLKRKSKVQKSHLQDSPFHMPVYFLVSDSRPTHIQSPPKVYVYKLFSYTKTNKIHIDI